VVSVITVELAERLLAAGLVWDPAAGDRFVVPGRGMDDEMFVVSQMTVDVHEFPQGRVIGFNGTTEWAMDSLELTEVLWMPAEGRLREELGRRFGGLRRDGDEWVVTVLLAERGAATGHGGWTDAGTTTDSGTMTDSGSRTDSGTRTDTGGSTEHRHTDPECAYALAVLEVLDF